MSQVSKSASNDKPVSVGVAGLGRSGWDIHVAALRELPEQFRVVAALDNLPERRREAADALGCRVYERYENLLADREVELVVVAVPTQLHADATIAAMRAGKHVVCEKPIARDLAECDRMIAAEKETGRLLTVFHNRRYSPTFLKVRQIVQSEALGRVNMIRVSWSFFRRRWDWQTVQALGGGMLLNYGAHRLDQIMEFAGPGDPEVFCKLDRALSSGDAEDFVRISLAAPGWPLLEVDIFMNCAYELPEWLVLGDRGTLLGGGGNRQPITWRVVRGGDALPRHDVDLTPVADRSYSQEKLTFDEHSAVAEDEFETPNVAFYRALRPALTARQAGRPGCPGDPPVTTASVRQRMAILDRCLKERAKLRAP